MLTSISERASGVLQRPAAAVRAETYGQAGVAPLALGAGLALRALRHEAGERRTRTRTRERSRVGALHLPSCRRVRAGPANRQHRVSAATSAPAPFERRWRRHHAPVSYDHLFSE
ncbi:hypothetical protein EVAR_94929_1 [Eumeta japonica]|uniref:Uncharacterized protein n=1 Tax=Eumeta variegata TaxID=151549 RepID=A0A4C1Z211_EUMVA|nr:hypothetical protein EVAR_94929_1 [Eumeta japonica]